MRKLSVLKAIRVKCLDCCCGSNTEVKLCPSEKCALWIYRFGKNPALKGKRKGNITALMEYRKQKLERTNV
jgi:hypothetical protein